MCLAKVYVYNNDEMFAQSVTNFRKDGNDITFFTIFGEEKTVAGDIVSIDFTDSVINVVSK